MTADARLAETFEEGTVRGVLLVQIDGPKELVKEIPYVGTIRR